LGHALAGFAVGHLAGQRAPLPPALLPACALLAVAPDLDFLPGWIAGQPALYHQGASHSFAAAACAAVLAAAVVARGGAGFARCLGWLFAAYVSHLVIDWLGSDGRPPLGMPLFWPLSDATYLSPVAVLPGISHSPTGGEGRAAWLASLLAWHNAWALAVELGVGAALLAVAEWRRRRWGSGQ
jgi:inner membrane protein